MNTGVIDKYVQHLKDNDVNGVYVHGTTGEGFSLTNAEKLSLAKAYKDAITKYHPKMLFMVNITSTCMKETIELAKELEQLGVDAFALLPPLYFKVSSVQELVAYMKLVSNAGAALLTLHYYITTSHPSLLKMVSNCVTQISNLTHFACYYTS